VQLRRSTRFITASAGILRRFIDADTGSAANAAEVVSPLRHLAGRGDRGTGGRPKSRPMVTCSGFHPVVQDAISE
jgi:hypothetical protein